MASTPPAQIRAEARTPPTPLHGSAYHSKSSPSRYNTRSSARKTPDSANSSFTHSPQSPHSTALHSHAELTPRRKTRRVQALSPVSPESDTAPPAHPSHNASYLSATAVLSEGMLPTPVKTPRKKHIPKSTVGARVLFQDPSNAVQSPRKTQKRVRHNGFSLESFSEASSSQDAIQIHIDSRDQVPEVDPTEDNPFHVPSQPVSKKRAAPSAPQRPVRSSKRQRLDKEEKKPLDPQVEDATRKDEGMVYVFRGKKVYRRFEDAGDEEEIIDPEELGLLERAANGHDVVKPLKTLTRKSIRPRRLFQDEIQQQQQQQQPASHTDEEAETEIEEDHPAEADDPDSEEAASPSRPKSSRTRDIATNGGSKKKSPFDSWKRLKSSSQSAPVSSVPATRGRKRTAAEALEV